MAGQAAARYAQLEADRQPYLDRARSCAKLTIPSLLPPEGSSASSKFTTPYQSVGARGVNNLSSKLLLTLFPPHTPHFKMAIDELTLQEITGQQGMSAEVEKALSAFVKKVMKHVETRGVRTSVFEALKQITVTGNALLFFPPTGGMRVFRLDKYVCKRDPGGTLLELTVRERIALSAIPEEVRALIPEGVEAVKKDGGKDAVAPPTEAAEKIYDLFTQVYLEAGEYVIFQEIEGVIVPGSVGRYPADASPWIPLRFVKVDGEDYGRSYIEEYLGDLSSLEDLTKAVVEFAAIASRVNPLVNPNGVTDFKKLMKAANGEPIAGRADDITYSQLDKAYDFNAAHSVMMEIEQRLAFAFLLNTAIQRPGERVTAEEIRFMARELEDALGGVYSIQSQELQLPLTKVIIAQLERDGELPELPEQIVPAIVTGIDALGRGHDLANLDALIGGAMELSGGAAAQYIHWDDYYMRRAAALGVDAAGLIKTKEEIVAEQQAAQQAAMMEKLGPNAVNQLGGIAQKSMETPPNGPQG